MTTLEAAEQSQHLDGVAIGVVLGFDDQGMPLVATSVGPDGARPARQTVALGPSDVGAQVAVLFEGGNGDKPIIVGRLLVPEPETVIEPEIEPEEGSSADADLPRAAVVDGDLLRLEAREQIELRCGKASIILTRAGKIILRGSYVVSRSTGANRIKGASVQIN